MWSKYRLSGCVCVLWCGLMPLCGGVGVVCGVWWWSRVRATINSILPLVAPFKAFLSTPAATSPNTFTPPPPPHPLPLPLSFPSSYHPVHPTLPLFSHLTPPLTPPLTLIPSPPSPPSPPQAQKKFIKISQAYEALTDGAGERKTLNVCTSIQC